MKDNPRKVIQNQEMFSKNDLLLVAVSGGLDSMVLCDVLHKLQYNFSIAHCNYQLRIPDANYDQEMIRKWANDRQIQFYSKECVLPNSSNIQDQARKARYAFFDELIKKHHFKYLLTAHHSDDQVELLFLQLSRGSGINGLKGMVMQSDIHIRPFLPLSKSDLSSYALENNIPYREDRSNEASYYLRNFFRNEVLPLIESRLPAFKQMTRRSMDHLQELIPLLQNLYESWKNHHVKISESEISIAATDPSCFLSWYLSDLDFHPETIQQIKFNQDKSGKLFYSRSNFVLAIHPDGIKIRKINISHSKEAEHLIYTSTGTLELDYGILEWTNGNPESELLFSDSNFCYFDSAQLKYPLRVRKWEPGDRIQVFGMNGKHKKIQDVFTDSKLGIYEKEKMYLLTTEENILWICGLQRSDHAKIDLNTRNVIQFIFSKKEV